MPTVKGQFVPEIEHAGRAKPFLDILLWIETLSTLELNCLVELEQLKSYLDSIDPFLCSIRIHVPREFEATAKLLASREIAFTQVNTVAATETTSGSLALAAAFRLSDAVSTALSIDADCLVCNEGEALVFIEDVAAMNILLTDCSFLLRYSEIFARGHDAPWAFHQQIWGMPWTAFYQMTESVTFEKGMALLYRANKAKCSEEAQESGRLLVHNRIPNLCFTRDRLFFYEIQRLVSKRGKWRRQEFVFEIAYYLNFYYLLIFGTFDHAALFVSQLLNLGLPEKQVGATYNGFLSALKAKSVSLHSIFTSDETREFIDRVAYLRHFAAHRGSLMPGKFLQQPDKEPTIEELDTEIATAGLDDLLRFLPDGEMKESFRETLRTTARIARCETIAEGVVPYNRDGKTGFIMPLLDTDWNFQKLMKFMNSVLQECAKTIG